MDGHVINQLPNETIKLISSAQVVTSISSVVKELVENSLDAGAKSIQVKLDNFGLDLIEVIDDGPGVEYGNVQKMFLSGYTSKITDFRDLSSLHSYGFRGEALSAICKLGETTITTKTEKDTLAMAYKIDGNGTTTTSKAVQIKNGTIISVRKIFSNLPVRKQYASSKKKMEEELKKVETILRSLSIIHPTLRVTLSHNKSNIWQKISVQSLKQSFMQVVGVKSAAKMEYINNRSGDIILDLFIPKKDEKDLDRLFVSSANMSFIHINKRPVFFKEISKLVMEHISQHFPDTGNKHVLYLVSVTLPPEEIDLNLEPNKTKVLLNNLDSVLSFIRETLNQYYGTNVNPTQDILPDELAVVKATSECAKIFESGVLQPPDFDDRVTMNTPSAGQARRSWSLTVVNDAEERMTPQLLTPQKLVKPPTCSQINKNNCTLTTDTEVRQLNEVISTPWGSSLASILESTGKKLSQTNNKNSNRSDWPSLQTTPVKHPSGRPILPEWPIRQITPQKTNLGSPLLEEVLSVPQPLAEVRRGSFRSFTANQSTSMESINQRVDEVMLPEDIPPIPQPLAEVSRDKSGPGLFNHSNSYLEASRFNEVMFPEDIPSVPQPLAEVSRDNNGPALFNHSKSYLEASTVADSNLEVEIAAEKISSAEWSRGQVKLTNGNILNGGTAVVNAKVREDVGMFDLSLQSVSSQMGKKELSAFTKYARIMRPKITSEEPGILFTEVSKRLVEGWRDLPADEKEYYEELAKVVDEERKSHRTQPKNTAVLAKRKSDKEIQQPERKKPHIKWPKRKSVEISISIEKIMKLKEIKIGYCESTELRLIGQLPDTKDWLYFKNGEICLIRHDGLQELVLYHRMMNTHEITKKKLDNSILLTNEVLGASWNILLTLPTYFDESTCQNVVVHDVITKNGFRIEFQIDEIPKLAFITEVASEIENYGVNDLNEVLQILNWHGDSAKLSELRPTAVKKYIMSEVMRLVQKNRTPPEEADMKSLLNTWQLSLKDLPPLCLHQRNIFVPIHKVLPLDSENKVF